MNPRTTARRLATAILAALLTGPVRADEPPVPFAEAWDECEPSVGRAYRADSRVLIALEELPESRELLVPRLYNRMRSAYWLGDESRTPLALRPELTEWRIRLDVDPPGTSDAVVVLEMESMPRLSAGAPIRPVDRVIDLPAHLAETHGEFLRYEPQPHKNTVGYWTKPDDWAEWRLEAESAGEFQVDILQGCGNGQGGSEVELLLRPDDAEDAVASLLFQVEQTGHFQAFRQRGLGTVNVPRPGTYRLELRPRRMANRAVMDVRNVRLQPVGEAPALQTTRPPRPNVLILFTDDQGTLDAGCYGSRDLFTPYIDGLASRGVRFTQAYGHTVCCPARAMLMTGRHPQRSGVNSWMQRMLYEDDGLNMDTEEVTLAEALREQGYRTALFGKWHLGAAIEHGPTRQGFDEFFGPRDGFIDNFNHYHLHREGFHDLYRGTEEAWHAGEFFPDLMTAEAEQFLDRHAARHADQPFLLYAAFNIPHYPEQPDAKFDQFYAGHKMPRQSFGRVMSTADDRIGRVLAKLDEYGLRDDTIVIFMSDNGHSAESYSIGTDDHSSGYPRGHVYGAHGGGGNTGKWIGHKGTFLEGGIRVPAIISYPGRLPEGEVRDQAMTAMDWFPTVLDLCNIEVPASVALDGHSLLPTIDQNADSPYNVMHWQWQDRWCVREGDWKLISDGDGLRLVSLRGDEPERVDHAGDQPETVERLHALHDEWSADVGRARE